MKRVLVLNNNEEDLRTLEQTLRASSFDVRTTWSGREALELLTSEEFDALVVDDYLPDMHVDSFLVMVAKLPVRPIILVMTPEPNLKDTKRFENLKVTKVVDKRLLHSMPQSIALLLERECDAAPAMESAVSTPAAIRTNSHSSGRKS
jgi:CheY-like chemotaxis protein